METPMYSQEYFDQLATLDNDTEALTHFMRLAGLNLEEAELTRMIGSDQFNLRDLLAKSFSSLERDRVLGDKGATLLKLLNILILQFLKAKIRERDVISNLSDLHHYLTMKMSSLHQEQVILLVLDSRNQLICECKLASGLPNYVVIHPGQVIKKLVEHDASAFILVHNHPSGSTKPSQLDIEQTLELDLLCSRISVTFHDHVIVGCDQVFSMRAGGFFDRRSVTMSEPKNKRLGTGQGTGAVARCPDRRSVQSASAGPH